MIIHSTANTTSGTCLVRVEGIEPGMAQPIVQIFAQGAAGKHNPGYDVPASALQWCDGQGEPLPDGSDTTGATIARVLCRIEAP